MRRLPQCTLSLPLTLFDLEGWHDRLLEFLTEKGVVSFVVYTRLGGPPLSYAILDQAHRAGAGSLDAYDVSARKELARRRR